MASQPQPQPYHSPYPGGAGGTPYRVGASPQQQQAYAYPQHQVYHGHPDMSAFGLVTPPTQTPPTFGSPLIASGAYPPAASPWSLNALALQDQQHYYAAAGAAPYDPSCAAPGELFAVAPQVMHDPSLVYHGMHPLYRRDQLGAIEPAHLKGQAIMRADGQPAEVKKRSRTAQACERCRVRKARCFGGNPCNRCTKRRFVCEFSTAVRQRGPNKPSAAAASSATPTSSAGPEAADGAAPSPEEAPDATVTPTTKTPAGAKPAPRRHSLPEQPQVAHYNANVPPTKSLSTDVTPYNATVTEEATGHPVAFSLPSSAVIPQHAHIQQTEYLAVPAGAGAAFPRTHSDSGALYTGLNGTRSPVFAFTPESADSSAPPSSVDYPYTPISPITTFSPTLTMTPTVNMSAYAAQAVPVPSPDAAAAAGAHPHQQWYQATS
ncbi:hypothetical protein Q8F55_006280 [Vanrija albida]|uniref:Zn(2)-C6 fungal-type domain-containing protein n=1 Tax=Vanrija albida TaxID=181172 RepID=A0ABR3PWP9_9TREE